MTEILTNLSGSYDPVILVGAWHLRQRFLASFEAEEDEKKGFILNQWLSGDETSLGCYSIAEWDNSGPHPISNETSLLRWITDLSKFSTEPEIIKHPEQVAAALIDICLTQNRLVNSNG
jgi:hypothetical protein